MKKIILILVFGLFYTNAFAQTKLTNKQSKKIFETIKNSLCDCANQQYKGLSPEFYVVIEKMAKEIRKTKKTSPKYLQEHFKNNPADAQKLQDTERNIGCEDIDFDFGDDVDMEAEEEKEFLVKNFPKIIDMMKKDKKCSIGLVTITIRLSKK